MKNAVLTMISILILLLDVMIYHSVNTRSVREAELKQAVSNGVSESLNMTLEDMAYINVDEDTPDEEIHRLNERMSEMCRKCIMAQMDSDSDLEIHIITADFQKGILDVEVTERFTYINNRPGEIYWRKTGLLVDW